MTQVQESRGGFVGFLGTVPGILTAIAALITAGTGGVVYLANDNGSGPGGDEKIIIVTQEAPTVPTDADAAAVDAWVNTGLSSDDPVQVMIDSCGNGDLNACASVLVTLAQECQDGYALSCDVLYAVSPLGSDYEWYGGTCGGYRFHLRRPL